MPRTLEGLSLYQVLCPFLEALCRDACCLDKTPQPPAASNLASNGFSLREGLSRPMAFSFPLQLFTADNEESIISLYIFFTTPGFHQAQCTFWLLVWKKGTCLAIYCNFIYRAFKLV